MMPMALSVVGNRTGTNPFSKSLLLGIAYSASIGGMAKLTGTPPNAVVFSSEHLKINEMAVTGFWMNLFSTIVISLLVWFVLPLFW